MNIAASGQHMYRRLCEALDVKHLIDDPRFTTPQDRSKNRVACNEELEKATATKTSAEWVEILNKAGVPCGPILNVKEVFEDEQVRALGLSVKIRHPRLGEQEVQNLPVTLSRTPGAVRTASPDLGEHTDQVLAELGYSREEIAALHRDGAV
jgi:formyl-CoA transferase